MCLKKKNTIWGYVISHPWRKLPYKHSRTASTPAPPRFLNCNFFSSTTGPWMPRSLSGFLTPSTNTMETRSLCYFRSVDPFWMVPNYFVCVDHCVFYQGRSIEQPSFCKNSAISLWEMQASPREAQGSLCERSLCDWPTPLCVRDALKKMQL